MNTVLRIIFSYITMLIITVIFSLRGDKTAFDVLHRFIFVITAHSVILTIYYLINIKKEKDKEKNKENDVNQYLLKEQIAVYRVVDALKKGYITILSDRVNISTELEISEEMLDIITNIFISNEHKLETTNSSGEATKLEF